MNYASDFADCQLFLDSQLLIFPSQLLDKLNVVVTPSIVNTQLFPYQNEEGTVAMKTNYSRSWTGNRLSAEREPLLSSLRNQAREHFSRFLNLIFEPSDVLMSRYAVPARFQISDTNLIQLGQVQVQRSSSSSSLGRRSAPRWP